MNKINITLEGDKIGVDGSLGKLLEFKECYPQLVITNEDNTRYDRIVLTKKDIEKMFESWRLQLEDAEEHGFTVK